MTCWCCQCEAGGLERTEDRGQKPKKNKKKRQKAKLFTAAASAEDQTDGDPCTSAGDDTGLLYAAVRDAAFETAVEGGPGVEITGSDDDAGRPAVGAEVERADGAQAGKGVDTGVRHWGAADNGTDIDCWCWWRQCS